IDSMPIELDDLSREIMLLEIEEKAMSKDMQDDTEKENPELEKKRKKIAELKEKFQGMKLQWENEKNEINKIQNLKAEIEKVNAKIAELERKYELEKVAELKFGKLPELQNKLKEEEQKSEE